MTVKKYAAPWSISLIVISTVVSLICVVPAVALALDGRFWIAALLLGIVFASALFTVRGYSLCSEDLVVYRLFWTTRVSLTGMLSSQVAPDAMRGSIRTFGNGGLFSFTGWFNNWKLGSYRAFVTDPHRAVVLNFDKHTIVLSPGVPEDFVHDIRSIR